MPVHKSCRPASTTHRTTALHAVLSLVARQLGFRMTHSELIDASFVSFSHPCVLLTDDDDDDIIHHRAWHPVRLPQARRANHTPCRRHLFAHTLTHTHAHFRRLMQPAILYMTAFHDDRRTIVSWRSFSPCGSSRHARGTVRHNTHITHTAEAHQPLNTAR